jgi:hypothetical protein
LIVLTILLDAQIISPRIFTAMILMALFSAALTMPLARLALARVPQRASDQQSVIGKRVAPVPNPQL